MNQSNKLGDTMTKTFTVEEIHSALDQVRELYPDNPDMPVAYILGDVMNKLDIL